MYLIFSSYYKMWFYLTFVRFRLKRLRLFDFIITAMRGAPFAGVHTERAKLVHGASSAAPLWVPAQRWSANGIWVSLPSHIYALVIARHRVSLKSQLRMFARESERPFGTLVRRGQFGFNLYFILARILVYLNR